MYSIFYININLTLARIIKLRLASDREDEVYLKPKDDDFQINNYACNRNDNGSSDSE